MGNLLQMSITSGQDTDSRQFTLAASSHRLAGETYDANGNRTSGSADGFTSVSYNILNLPETVTTGGRTINYLYSARWSTPDPLSEKYYAISPYAYCAGNPVNLVDPEGMELYIHGKQSESALSQIQAWLDKRIDKITLSIDENGLVSYSNESNKKIKGDVQKFLNMLDDKSIKVNLNTISGNHTDEGYLVVGGAFMGNTIETNNETQETTVIANQTINPETLKTIDDFKKSPGKMIMHEVSEAYYGARISL